MAQRKKRAAISKQPEYQPTDSEKATLTAHAARLNSAMPLPQLKVNEIRGDVVRFSVAHPDCVTATKLLMEALGTTDSSFAHALITQLINASSVTNINQAGLDFMLAVIKDNKPKDQFEAMLAAQMAAVHMSFMSIAAQMARVQTVAELGSFEGVFNKLARTFTTQLETFKRYRTGGEQKVTVHHVSVGEGGQAIVGTVTQNTSKARTKFSPTTPALTDARKPEMPIIGEQGRAPVSLRRKKDVGQ